MLLVERTVNTVMIITLPKMIGQSLLWLELVLA